MVLAQKRYVVRSQASRTRKRSLKRWKWSPLPKCVNRRSVWRYSRPYADTMRKVIGHLANGNLEYKHPYLEERDVKRVGYLVVSTDRGLCGGLNINLFKKLLAEMKAWSDKGVQCELAMIGSKGVSFFNSVSGNVVAQVTGMGDNPSLSELIGPVKVMLQAYDEGRLDKLYIVSNKFINTMSQVPTITQLLPLPASEDGELKRKSWDYLYEPDPKALLDTLLRRYVESQVYQGVVENLVPASRPHVWWR